jgi:hypothetical protein
MPMILTCLINIFTSWRSLRKPWRPWRLNNFLNRQEREGKDAKNAKFGNRINSEMLPQIQIAEFCRTLDGKSFITIIRENL